jgi:hypothetical protein
MHALQKAINSGHTDAAPAAAVNLGELLRSQEHLQDAKTSGGDY